MKDYLKFLARLPKSLRKKLIDAVAQIAEDDLANLDVMKMQGSKEFYRVRLGKIRIIFRKTPLENEILDIGFRGGIYK